jgi:hypothetical protein
LQTESSSALTSKVSMKEMKVKTFAVLKKNSKDFAIPKFVS